MYKDSGCCGISHQTKQNKTKQNKTKQNKTKQNKTKQNKTKQNKTTRIIFPSFAHVESELLSSDQTYTSKFYEPQVQAIVEQNRAMLEPDAITEALEAMRNNPVKNAHSSDCMNDQENSDVEDELLNDSDPNKSFIEQQPSDLDPTQSNELSTCTITYHNQPCEISDDELCK